MYFHEDPRKDPWNHPWKCPLKKRRSFNIRKFIK
jgi:hypothetical protein